MSATMIRMADKKKPGDRHKPSRMLRLPELLAKALEELAREDFNSITEQAKIAVREYLERRDRLPKPKPSR